MDHMRELKSQGYRQTAPRTLILQVLEGGSGHMTAAQIADRLSEGQVPLTRSTVYRTLETLTEAGIIKGSQIGRAVFYELLDGDRGHHHMMCTRCHRTIHMEGAGTDRAVAREAELANFAVTEIQVLVSGVCRECQAT